MLKSEVLHIKTKPAAMETEKSGDLKLSRPNYLKQRKQPTTQQSVKEPNLVYCIEPVFSDPSRLSGMQGMEEMEERTKRKKARPPTMKETARLCSSRATNFPAPSKNRSKAPDDINDKSKTCTVTRRRSHSPPASPSTSLRFLDLVGRC